MLVVRNDTYQLRIGLDGHYLRSLSSDPYYSPIHTAIKFA